MNKSKIKERREIIEEIEEERNSDLIVYFCGDRPILPSRISEDAVRPF